MARKRAKTRLKATRLKADVPSLRLDALLVAIAAINPTGRELPHAVSAARYRDKGRLQSQLIDECAAELVLWPDEHDARLVLLACRRTLRTAGHAVINDLEPDARSWVRRQIDLGRAVRPPGVVNLLAEARAADQDLTGGRQRAAAGAGSPPRATAAREGLASAVAGALLAGEAALLDYDYSGAIAQFETALTESAGGRHAATALLEVWVDHLADDAAATALGPRLPAATRDDPAVAGLLLVAAARAGTARPDEGLMARAAQPRVASALLLHTAAALDAERLADARRWMDQLSASPTPPRQLPQLEARYAKVVAAQQRAAEARLEAAAAALSDDALRAQAEALLATYPQSEVAGRILRSLDAAEAARALAALVRRAEASLSRGDFTLALRRFRAAVERGASESELATQMRAACEGERRRAEELLIEETRALIAHDARAGLLAWLRLNSVGRAAVRAEVDCPALTHLADLVGDDHNIDGGRARDAVAGAQALAAALALLRADDAAAALERLEPHRVNHRTWRCLTETMARIQTAVTTANERLARSWICEISAILDDGEAGRSTEKEAIETASAVMRARGQIRPPSLLAAAQALDARLERAHKISGLRARQRVAEHEEDWLMARGLSEERQGVAALAGRPHRDTAQRDAARLDRRVRRQWRQRVFHSSDLTPLGPAPHSALDWRERETVGGRIWSLDGDLLTLVLARERWLFIRRVRVADGMVQEAMMMRTPTSLAEAAVCIDRGMVIAITAGSERLLEVRLVDWRIERWEPLAHAGVPAVGVLVLPSGDLLMTGDAQGREIGAFILDRSSRRIRRHLPGVWGAYMLRLSSGVLLATQHSDSVRFYDESGAALSDAIRPNIDSVDSLVAGPASAGPCIFGGPKWDIEQLSTSLHLALYTPSFAPLSLLKIPDFSSSRPFSACVGRGVERLFVAGRGEAEPALVAIERKGDTLCVAWRVGAPKEFAIIGGEVSDEVVAVWPDGGGLGIARLTADALDVPFTEPEFTDERLPFMGWFHAATPDAASDVPEVLHNLVRAGAHAAQRVDEAIEVISAAYANKPHCAQFAHVAMSGWPDKEAASVGRARLLETFPQDGGVWVSELVCLANDGQWEALTQRAARRPANVAPHDDLQAQELTSTAHLRCGRIAAAVAALDAADTAEVPSLSLLRMYLAACQSSAGAADSKAHALGAQNQWVALVRGIVAARRCLSAGQPQAALAALSHPQLQRQRELQSHATRVEARLQWPAQDAAGELAEADELSSFLEIYVMHDKKFMAFADLPIPGVSLGETQLNALAKSAESRLQALTVAR